MSQAKQQQGFSLRALLWPTLTALTVGIAVGLIEDRHRKKGD